MHKADYSTAKRRSSNDEHKAAKHRACNLPWQIAAHSSSHIAVCRYAGSFVINIISGLGRSWILLREPMSPQQILTQARAQQQQGCATLPWLRWWNASPEPSAKSFKVSVGCKRSNYLNYIYKGEKFIVMRSTRVEIKEHAGLAEYAQT